MDYTFKNPGRCRTEKPNQARFRMHAHDLYEIYCFLSGDADYYVEGNPYRLQPGDIMLMRKSESHVLMLKSEAPYERIVMNFDLPFLEGLDPDHYFMRIFDDRPLGQYNHYSAALFPDNHWVYYLEKMCEFQEPHKQLAFLMPLLAELSECFETVKEASRQQDPDSITSVIRYINQYLTANLSLSLLSERFYLSKAHLNRIFKQSTGSTVWNYIVIKRLLLAREMLLSGQTPTEVYGKCGFQDYTTFFRAYKKHFGTSPKNDQSQ
ncbi:MAG: helix-turn-helix domain-containing protein [Clostridia bacterium]|nr:helix-turn-helix domain-containing protein [Clostridia bacterium]